MKKINLKNINLEDKILTRKEMKEILGGGCAGVGCPYPLVCVINTCVYYDCYAICSDSNEVITADPNYCGYCRPVENALECNGMPNITC
jgi:natural product precursor